MAGRKPKPTRLKLITGNPGKRRLNEREPKPKAVVPRCPVELCDAAKKEWRRIGKQLAVLGLLTEIDRAARLTSRLPVSPSGSCAATAPWASCGWP